MEDLGKSILNAFCPDSDHCPVTKTFRVIINEGLTK